MSLIDQDSFYINITSDANPEHYPNNKTSNFSVQLPETIQLSSAANWKVGLATIQYPCDINNIGPTADTQLHLWDGYNEQRVIFPNWHCESITHLIEHLNDRIESYTTKTQYSRSSLAHAVPENNTKWMTIRALLELNVLKKKRKDINKPAEVWRVFGSPASGDSEDVVTRLPILEAIDNTRARYIELYKDASSINEKYVAQFKKHLQRKDPPVKFTVDKLKRTYVHTTMPAFDMGISESLRTILGLHESDHFSIENYTIRKKFHAILKRNTLTAMGVEIGYSTLNEQYKYSRMPTIEHILESVFDVGVDFFNLWCDILVTSLYDLNNSEITPDIVKSILEKPVSENWPKSDPYWSKYLDHEDFYSFIMDFENVNSIVREQGDITTFGKQFVDPSYRGLLVAIYMLKTLAKRPLFLKPLYAEVPGQLNPNEFMQIYLDIVRPEPFNGLLTSLLALIKSEGRPGETARYEANRIQYKSLAVNEIRNLKVLVLSPSGKPIPFQRGPLLIQLHFIRERRGVQLY